jgi:gliding motility-associated-like protein
MTRIIYILFFSACLSPIFLWSQDNTFYRKYNLGGMQGGLQLATTTDGGFVATGQHEGNGSAGGCDIYVYRVDICGNIVWFKLYGLGSTDGGKSINQTADGGFIVSGHYNGGQGFNLKIDGNGEAEWLKTYSGMSWVMYSVEASNGDYLCLGHDGNSSILFRCDSNGEVIWSKYMSGIGNMGLYLKELNNGDIVFTSVQIGVGKDFYLTRLTSLGNVVWSKGYGLGWGDTDHTNWSNRGTVDEVNDVITLTCPTTAGGQGGENVLVAQVNLTSGAVLWSKSYGGGGSDQSRDIAPHPGGFAIVGNTDSFNVGADPVNNITEAMSERDILLFDIDTQGNLQWTRTYGGSQRDRGIGVQFNMDNGFTIAAFTGSPVFGNFDDSFDPLFMKTEGDGWVSCQMHSPLMIQSDVTLSESVSGSSNPFLVVASLPGFVENDYAPQDNYVCQSCSTVPIFEPSDTMVCVGETIQFINTTQIGLTCFQQWYVEGQAYNGGNDLSYVFNAPGDYTVELYSTCGGAASTYDIVIHVYEIGSSFTTSDYNGFDVSCFGSNDGHIQVNGTGGYLGSNPTYSISWSDGIQGFYRSGLIAGVYEYSLMDSIGCSITEQIVITEPTDLLLDVLSNHNYNGYDISCYGLNDGGVTANVAGGVAPYSFGWVNPVGNIQMSIENLPVGVYSCQTTDANGCVKSNQLELIQPDQLIGNVNVVSDYNGFNVTCFGSSDGAFSFSFTGGVIPISSQIESQAILPGTIVNNFTGGYHNIVLLDINGCVENIPFEITSPAPLELYLSPTQYFEGYEITCFGMSDGGANLNIVGGVGPMNMQWSNGVTNQLGVNGLQAGYYTVDVQDANGCQAATGIDINEPPLLEVDFTFLSDFNGFQVSCNGSDDGVVAIDVTGGTGDYTYAWSNGFDGSIQSNMQAGQYSVLVDDSNECGPLLLDINLLQPSEMTVQMSVTSNFNGEMISCFGFADAQALIQPNGGVHPYTYLWEDGATGINSSNNNGVGYLNCQVIDQNNCAVVDSIYIEEPAPIEGSIIPLSNFNGFDISCFDSNDGAMELFVQGGTGNLNVIWSNGQTNFQSNGWGSGPVSVFITDENGCNQTLTYTVQAPLPLQSVITSVTNYTGSVISCHGANDGQLEVSVTGGAGAYDYFWSDGSITSSTNADLGSGIYSVNVLDANLCSVTEIFEIFEPEEIAVTLSSLMDYNGFDVACYNQTNGGVIVNVSGGVGIYYFEWLNTQNEIIGNTSTLTDLGAGMYTVLVTDPNNCGPISGTIELFQPSPLFVQMNVVSNYNGFHISCFNSNDGQANAIASGGLPPYAYSWSDESTTFISGIDLSSGIAQCLLSDLNGCQILGEIDIIPPLPLQQSVSITSDYNGAQLSCHDASDGIAEVTTTGGAGSYNYNWSDGQLGNIALGLTAGNYWVESTDANLCEVSTSFTIVAPDTLDAMPFVSSNYNGSAISCFQNSDGEITALVTGGTGPYDVSWQMMNLNGSGNVASGLPPGNITFLVEDSNGCITSASTDISEPNELVLTTEVLSDYSGFGVSCFGSQNGFMAGLVTGGTGDYNIVWSNGQTGFVNESLGVGSYSAQVTDENGCLSNIEFQTITEPLELVVSSYTTSDYNGFGVSCYGASDGWIEASTSGGVEPINFIWSNGALTNSIYGLPSDFYYLQVFDANNCFSNQIVLLNEPNDIALNLSYSSDFCSLGFGQFQADVIGGVGQSVFFINGVFQASLDSAICCFVGGDETHIIAEDENGCSADSTFYFPNIEPPIISLNILSGDNICQDFTAVQLVPSSNYYPIWYSIPANTQVDVIDDDSLLVQVNADGLVNIEITGEIFPGCASNGSIEVEVIPSLKVFVPNSFTPGNDNVNDGFKMFGENIEYLEWSIFDRWGDVIHVNNDVKGYWNGTNQNDGLECIQGVYQYAYRAESYCGEVVEGRGHLVLLR